MARKETSPSNPFISKSLYSGPLHFPRLTPLYPKPVLLPEDIIIDILSRLPVKPLAMCSSCVCKIWNAIASNILSLWSNKLSKTSSWLVIWKPGEDLSLVVGDEKEEGNITPMALEYLPFSYHRFLRYERVLLGICNGFTCFSVLQDQHRFCSPPNPIYILNPFTGEHMRVPISNLDLSDNRFVSGLGFDRFRKLFKVVLVVFYSKPNTHRFFKKETLIYNIHTNSSRWRVGSAQPPDQLFQVHRKSSTTHINGSLHWLVVEDVKGSRIWVRGEIAKGIVSFSLETEEFGFIPTPECGVFHSLVHVILGEVGGCLSITAQAKDDIQIWTMKEYNVKESWIKLYHISQTAVPYYWSYPFCVPLNDEILLRCVPAPGVPLVMVCYNIQTGNCREVEFGKSCQLSREEAIPFVGSLRSLKQLTKD